jgi:hypothetical protein
MGCHLYFARRVTFLSCADIDCRSPIETSPASPIEMSRSSVCLRLVGVAWDDGDHDEPQGADAPAGADRYGDGRLSVADATGLLGVGRRRVYRLLDAFRACGPDGLISRKRGGPSNRSLGAVFRETVLAIVRERYIDCSAATVPTSASGASALSASVSGPKPTPSRSAPAG